jgi:hypothetical protein
VKPAHCAKSEERMNIKPQGFQREAAITLVDAIMAMAVAAVLFGGLYAGLAFGFNTIKFARENTRATQILLERMETARLYTWSQINSNGFIPTNRFTVPYYSLGGTNTSLMYTGQVVLADTGLGTTYAGDMKKITIELKWVTGNTPRTRSMSTFVSKNGMQSYVF